MFARNDDTGLSYVKRQPLNDDEIALAEEAIGACATESIGNDGSKPDASAVPAP
jgi:ferredoxin